ncbi:DUF7310 family coiled-coil domain-containing protein [Halomarina pelagica]|uniref:DUF7310 family coiled-coil domain-containing protein n=1 Tax=Halomarina pelagica TaxID=2961599 RepID=UPI0020C551F3|nr:hypothetical protein [Halomarina sp. BND7]
MADDTLSARIDALERALTDGRALPDLADEARVATRLTEIEDRVDELDDRIADLDAAVQALRGYVGEVRRVDRAVERRADAAIAAVESLEGTIAAADLPSEGRRDAPDEADGSAAPSESAPGPRTRLTDGPETDVAGTPTDGEREADEVDGALARLRNAL